MTYDEFRKLKVNDIIHRKIDANDNIYVFKITMIDDNGTKGQFYDPFYKDWVLVPPDYVGTRNYVSLIAGDAVEKLDIPETITDEYVEEKWKELQRLNIGDLNNKHTALPVTWFLFPQGTLLGDVTAWFDEQHSKGLSYLLNLDTSSEEEDTLEALVGDVEERSNTLAIDVEEEDGFDIDTGEDDEDDDDDIEAESIISVFGAGNSMPLSKGNTSNNKKDPGTALNEESDPLWRDDISGFYPNHTLEDTIASESESAEKVVSDSVWDKESDLEASSDSLWKSNMSSSADAAGQDEPESDSLENTLMTSDVLSDQETDTVTEVPDETLEKMEPWEDTQTDTTIFADEPAATEIIDELPDEFDEPEAFDTTTVEEATPVTGSPEESNDTDQVNAGSEALSFEEPASNMTSDTVEADTVSANATVNTADTASAATAASTKPDTVSVKKPDTDTTAFKEHNREDKIMNNHTVDSDVMKQAAASIRDEYLKLADQVASLSEEHFSAIQKYLTEQGVTDTNDGLIAFLKTHKNLLTSIYDTGIQVAADDGSPVTITPKMLTQIQKQLDIQAGKEIVLNSNPQELSDEDYLEIYHNFQNQ